MDRTAGPLYRSAAALALFLTASTADAAPPDDTRAYCAELHPQSYQMRTYCLSSEEAAKKRVEQSAGLPYGMAPDVYAYCLNLHRSWQMVEFCGRREMQAREQWNRR